ncbi:unnamed protein product [Staurois parvus]|uniref:Uncharacterized protein n=1 Tax=Staurois parvus TaxID=386267 RepID=A0ABN9EIW6_9NEOB|nr:unnamed protein product [Staurois parvus]
MKAPTHSEDHCFNQACLHRIFLFQVPRGALFSGTTTGTLVLRLHISS